MLRTKVEEVIEVVRPIIQADQGDVVLHDVDEESGVVTVELVGACVTCPENCTSPAPSARPCPGPPNQPK